MFNYKVLLVYRQAQCALIIAIYKEKTTIMNSPQVSAQTPETAPVNSGLNPMALTGFILSFFIPVLGFIFSLIGLTKGNNQSGTSKGLAIAGIVISIFVFIFQTLLTILFLPPFVEGFNEGYNESLNESRYNSDY